MKYIWKSLKDFITKETPVFLLLVICICSSVIIIIFSYGFSFQIKQEKEDAKSYDRKMMIEFQDESREIVTKGGVMDILLSLSSKATGNCNIAMEGRFQEDKTDNPAIDNSMLAVCMDFCIEDGKVTVAPLEEMFREENVLVDGDYFTAEQVENGEYVCIAAKRYDGFGNEEEKKWADKYYANTDNVYEIDGKKYTCIGHHDSFTVIPWIPVTTVSDDVYVQRISMVYDKPITRNQYKEIASAFRLKYGDLAIIPELSVNAADGRNFYTFLSMLTFVIAALSGVVLACLYKYMLMRRQRRMTIFRLCGLSRKKTVGMFFTECLMLSFSLYVISVTVYVKALLPRFGQLFEYMEQAYNMRVYCNIGFIYLFTVLGILLVMIHRFVRNEIIGSLKGV